MKSIRLISHLLCYKIVTIFAFSVGSSRVFVGTPVNQNRRLVSDCMTPLDRLCTLTTDATVAEAVHMLLDLNVSGAPVIDKATGKLLGVVSNQDFLQQEAGEGTLLPFEGTIENVQSYLKKAKKICAASVGDLMTSDPVTLDSKATMRDAAIIMARENLHRLPIVDDGRLIGMLTSSDVMLDMVRVVKNLPPASDGSPGEVILEP